MSLEGLTLKDIDDISDYLLENNLGRIAYSEHDKIPILLFDDKVYNLSTLKTTENFLTLVKKSIENGKNYFTSLPQFRRDGKRQ
jgi:hypothetical protein